jgi:hypothetical protein
MVAALAATFAWAAPARAEEADASERSVLGGSPPIYASVPVTSLVAQSYKRFRVVPRGDAPAGATAQTGTRCATRLGLFGPGRSLPVNTACVGRDPQNQLAKGRVVPDGTGTYCATASGLFGPGPEQPIGLPCSAETKGGAVQGRIAVAE